MAEEKLKRSMRGGRLLWVEREYVMNRVWEGGRQAEHSESVYDQSSPGTLCSILSQNDQAVFCAKESAIFCQPVETDTLDLFQPRRFTCTMFESTLCYSHTQLSS